MTDVLKDAVTAAMDETTAETSSGRADAVVRQVAKTPVQMNALNQEPWYQSRVANYGSAIGLVSMFRVGQQVLVNRWDWASYDIEELGYSATVLLGVAGVIWGRFAKGLKPMWNGIANWIRGE